MKKTCWLLPGMVAMLLVVSGCSQNLVRHGNGAVDQGNYHQAKTYFELALEKNPNDFAAHRGLGQVFYNLDDFARAIHHLDLARRIRPKDGLAILYLGLAKEAQKDFPGARAIYENYLEIYPKSKIAPQIRGRLLYVHNEKVRQQAEQAVRFESALISDTTDVMTIGILPYLLTGEGVDTLRPLLRPLAAGFTAAMSNDLNQIGSIRIVERLQLKYILDELARVEAGFVAEESSPRVGRLLGADRLVNGNLGFSGMDQLEVHSGAINTADSSYKPAFDSAEKFSEIWKLQKQNTLAIIDTLGIPLTQEERNAIRKMPTESFEAFLAYGSGIEQLDQGDYEQAHEYFSQAVTLDPGFEQAASLQEETELLIEGGGTIEEFEDAIGDEIAAEADVGFEAEEDEIYGITEEAIEEVEQEVISIEGTVSVKGTIR